MRTLPPSSTLDTIMSRAYMSFGVLTIWVICARDMVVLQNPFNVGTPGYDFQGIGPPIRLPLGHGICPRAPISNGTSLQPIGDRLFDIWGPLQPRYDGQTSVLSLSPSTVVSGPMLVGPFVSSALCASEKPGRVAGRLLGEEPGLLPDVTMLGVNFGWLSTGFFTHSKFYHCFSLSTFANASPDLCASVDMLGAPGRFQEATRCLIVEICGESR